MYTLHALVNYPDNTEAEFDMDQQLTEAALAIAISKLMWKEDTATSFMFTVCRCASKQS